MSSSTSLTELDASYVHIDDTTGTGTLSSTPTSGSLGTGSGTGSSSASPVLVEKVDTRSNQGDGGAYILGSTPSYAHDWSKAGTGGGLRVQGRDIVDAYGRACYLRGVNLAGCCKTPVDHDDESFPEVKPVTFVGRPFPLEEAHDHLARLRRWGLTFVRFLVTWEAIEAEGPGIYDHTYLTYLHHLLALFPQYGLTAFVSMHQDVWSRYCGGSGAPAWTLTSIGLDISKLEETGAAWLKGMRGGGYKEGGKEGDERGLWPCGYQKMAAGTMATVFWAGGVFAPKVRVRRKTAEGGGGEEEEVNVQVFLQDAFLGAWRVLVEALRGCEAVVGFEMLNEPHRGYIEVPSLHAFDYNTDLHLGPVPSVLQSFALGAGHTLSIPFWTRTFPMPTKLTHTVPLNPSQTSAWREDGPTQGKCVWEMHGVWGWDNAKGEAVVLRESYFGRNPQSGEKIDWYKDFYYPFLNRWADMVRGIVGREKMVFTEAIPNEFCPRSWTPEHRPKNMVYAPHWYDLNALFRKEFGNFSVNVQALSRGAFPLKTFHWGHGSAQANYSAQIARIVDEARESLGETPAIIGECGVPMDMNGGEAFRTDDWTWQARMMDALLTALERARVGFTLWNYNPPNTPQDGDAWNGENFSLFSSALALPPSMLIRDQTSAGLDQGARAQVLRAAVRVYGAKVAGRLLEGDGYGYDVNGGVWRGGWVQRWGGEEEKGVGGEGQGRGRADETEIYVPSLLTHGRTLHVSGLDPDEWTYDESRQTLFVLPHPPKSTPTPPSSKGSAANPEDEVRERTISIEVYVTPAPREMWEMNTLWTDYGGNVIAMFAVLVGVVVYLFSPLRMRVGMRVGI